MLLSVGLFSWWGNTETDQRPAGVGAPTRAVAHHWPPPPASRSIQRCPQHEAGIHPLPSSSLSSLHPSFLPPYTLTLSPLSLLYSGPWAFKRPRAVRASSSSRGEPRRVLPAHGKPPEPLWRAAHAGGRGHRGGPPVRLHHPHWRWVTLRTNGRSWEFTAVRSQELFSLF